MLVVGLTGGIGSGKTTAANLFAELGIELIDADELSREVVKRGSPALADIANHFGEGILNPEGELRRSELREIIFAKPQEKEWLEKLLHPLIEKLIYKRIAEARSPYCILVSPLLIETSQAEHVDRILVIDIPESAQLQRTLERDDSDSATIQAIINSQSSRELRLSKADDVLDNNLPRDSLPQRVKELHHKYLELANQGTQGERTERQ